MSESGVGAEAAVSAIVVGIVAVGLVVLVRLAAVAPPPEPPPDVNAATAAADAPLLDLTIVLARATYVVDTIRLNIVEDDRLRCLCSDTLCHGTAQCHD